MQFYMEELFVIAGVSLSDLEGLFQHWCVALTVRETCNKCHREQFLRREEIPSCLSAPLLLDDFSLSQ